MADAPKEAPSAQDWWANNATRVDSMLAGATPDPNNNVLVTDKKSGKSYMMSRETAGQMDPDLYTFEHASPSGKPLQVMELTPGQKMTRAKRFGQAAVGVGAAFIPGFQFDAAPLWLQRAAPLVNALVRSGVASGVGAGVDLGGSMAMGDDPDYRTAQAAATQQFMTGMAGAGLESLAPFGANHFMTKALRPNQKMLEQRPSLIEDALKLRTVVRKAGAEPKEAVSAGRAAAAELRGMIDSGQQAGLTLSPQDFTQRLLALRSKIDAEDTTGEAVKALDDFINEFMQRNGMGLDMATAQARKRGAQAKAKAVFKAERAGADVDVSTNVRAQGNRAVAGDLRTAINDALEQSGIRGMSGRTANQVNESIRQARAVADATRRAQNIQPSRLENLMGAMTGGAAANMATGSGPMGAGATALGLIAGQLANNPRAYSQYALLLSNPAFVSLLRSAPPVIANGVYDYTGYDRQRQSNPWAAGQR